MPPDHGMLVFQETNLNIVSDLTFKFQFYSAGFKGKDIGDPRQFNSLFLLLFPC